MNPPSGSTLSFDHPESLLEKLQEFLESGPGTMVGQTLELFLRSAQRVRVALPGSDSGEGLARSSEIGLAVRRYLDRDRKAGFATVNLCNTEHFLRALRGTDQDLVPVGSGLEPAGPLPSQSGSEPGLDLEGRKVPQEADLSRWLVQAVDQVKTASARIAPIRVQHGWVEAGRTAEAILNSRGLRAGRSRSRTWAALQVVTEAGGELFHRPQLLVGEKEGSLPNIGPVLERLQAFPFFHREARLEPGAALVFLPEAAAILIQAVATLFHGFGAGIGEPVGQGWRLLDDPHRTWMPFGGRFDDTGRGTGILELADGIHSVATLGEEGHGWRRSFRDQPERAFSNIVVHASGEPRPDRGFLVSELRILRLAGKRFLAVAYGNRLEDGAAAADGGRIRFTFNPLRIPAMIRGTCGPSRNTALGISTPELVLEPGDCILIE